MLDETKSESEANRRAAVAYLQTAINSSDGALRNALCRRAAELILPRDRSSCCKLGSRGSGRPNVGTLTEKGC